MSECAPQRNFDRRRYSVLVALCLTHAVFLFFADNYAIEVSRTTGIVLNYLLIILILGPVNTI